MKTGLTTLASVLAVLALSACGSAPPGTVGQERTDAPIDSGEIIGEQGPPRERARIHTQLAAAYYERGNLAVALEEVKIALAADSSYAPAYNVLGLVHADLRENDRAQANFARALQLNPSDPDINHNYGWFLCQSGREDLGIRHFLAAIRNPLYATPQKSYVLAASCALRKDREQDALEYYERALRLDPNYLAAVLGMAQLRYRKGELAESRNLISRYNKITEPTAESLWLALRIERKLGNKSAENNLAMQLRREHQGTSEYQALLKGQFD